MDGGSARKMKKSMKKSCTWKARMYRIPTYTPEFDQFDMVFGGSLKADNRWVVLAGLIPWKDIEEKYSKLFVANNGRPAIPVRDALGALILKEKMKSSDEELVEQIRESPYLQFFLGYEGYKYEIPFDPSMMVHFRKRLSADILKEINALIIAKSKQEDEKHDDEDKGNGSGEGESKEGENKGTLIVDATCAPEDMRFPHDVTLLDEAKRKTGSLIDTLQKGMLEGWEKPRMYRKRARKEFLTFIPNQKPRVNTIRKAVRTQIQYIERNLRLINEVINLLFSTGATSTTDKISGTINDFSGSVLYTEGKLIGYSMDLHTGEFTGFTSGLSVGGSVYKGYKFIFSY